MTKIYQAHSIHEDGIWQHYSGPARQAPALFLDRDGVLVEGVDYLHEPAKTRLIIGSGAVIAAARQVGYHIVIVTNQSGIGRGYFDWDDFIAVQNKIDRDLMAEHKDARVDAVLACPFSPDRKDRLSNPDHPGRKPNPGMLLAAARQLDIDLARSWIVGDSASDLQAGINAGIAGGVHVLTGHGEKERAKIDNLRSPQFSTVLVDTIADCLTEMPFCRP